MRECSPSPTLPRWRLQGLPDSEITMDAERINALGTLITDLRARTDALRGYL